MRRLILGLATHGVALGIGFAAGIYMLPILVAPSGPSAEVLAERTSGALYQAELTRELKGSDFLHWGEGRMTLTATHVVHEGRLSPGPDFKLYLMTNFAEDEEQFLALKPQARLIGDVRSFDGFVLELPSDVNLDDYSTVLVWCEAFGEFITAARYREN